MKIGANFFRSDLQVHTPRDINWNGRRYITDQDRMEYSTKFIKSCREKSLHAVAITDHHDTVFFKYIKEAALNELDETGEPVLEHERLIVFPGIEVSIARPSAQVLIIFDPDIDIDLYNQIPIKLGINPSPETDATTCQTNQLDISIQDIIVRFAETPQLEGKYIVFPNVKPGGYKTFLRAGNHTLFSNLPCVGGYTEGILYNDIREGDRNILEGKVAAWTTRAYGVFQTSDCRQDDLETLGSYTSWVKWAKPSAEALRQACLSKVCRISQITPIIPNIYLVKVSISNSKFLGSIDLMLNPQLNALIGGRGTGKSSFLEYVRWGLCDPSLESGEENDLRSFDKKRSSLVANTLKSVGATVTVDWIIDGVRHSVKRDSVTNLLELKIGNHAPRQANTLDIRTLIGIQSYSQKELSTVGVDTQELRRFIEIPIQTALNDISDRIEAVSLEIRQNVIRVRDKNRVNLNLSRERASRASIKEQTDSIREQLKDLPEENRLTINQNPLIEEELLYINSLKSKIPVVVEAINNLENSVNSLKETPNINETMPNILILAELQQQIDIAVDNFVGSLFLSTNEMLSTEPLTEWRESIQKWEVIQTAHNHKYLEAIRQNSQYEQLLSSLTEKEEQLRGKENLLVNYLGELERIGEPENELQENLEALVELYNQRRHLLETQCSQLIDLSSGQINASLAPGGDLEFLISVINKTIQGANISNDKIKTLVMNLSTNANPFESWHIIVNEIYRLWEKQQENDTDFVIPDLPTLRLAGLIDSELRRLASRIDIEKFITLLLTGIKEKPIFKYCVVGGETIDFEQASAGQQAGALLKVLLSSEGPPLIIDQPEDDLDNEIVAEIAKDIWEAKKKRQILFASHNANLVVNGDAELVVYFSYRGEGDHSAGYIKNIGSIDVPEIKEAIKNVMEGGERAFRLRQEKYGF